MQSRHLRSMARLRLRPGFRFSREGWLISGLLSRLATQPERESPPASDDPREHAPEGRGRRASGPAVRRPGLEMAARRELRESKGHFPAPLGATLGKA